LGSPTNIGQPIRLKLTLNAAIFILNLHGSQAIRKYQQKQFQIYVLATLDVALKFKPEIV